MDDIPDLVTELPENYEVKTTKTKDVASKEIDTVKPADEVITKKIPITIITGYLGSGKSTLLERIGKTSNKRLAIILNEFGDSAAIEKSVTIKDKDDAVEEWLDLGNGCLCCTVKDNGVLAIESLIQKSKGKIDYILLETTGIADPAPIAKMFWLDEGLASNVYIDGVVTVLDSEHILECLDDVGGHWHRENKHIKLAQTDKSELTAKEIEEEQQKLTEGITTAHLQISLADTILINKIDKIESDENYPQKLEQIKSRIRSINATTPIHTTKFGDIDLDKILDLKAFESTSEKLLGSINFNNDMVYHDNRISTITIGFPYFSNPDQFAKIEKFLQYILWENKVNGKDVEIHRTKGILVATGQDVPEIRVIQGVRDSYEMVEGQHVAEGIEENKLVFIGKNLNKDDLYLELRKYV